MVKNAPAEGLDQGNMINEFLDEMDELGSTWKASSPTCQQSSSSPRQYSRQQEGPSGGRLDVTHCDCGSLVPIFMCSIKSPVCKDASRVSRPYVTECDCRPSVLFARSAKRPVCGDASSALRSDDTQCDCRSSVSTIRHSETPMRRTAGD